MKAHFDFNLKDAIAGCISGTAAGDSLGLLYENLTPVRQKKLYPDISKQKFFFGRGMISDDTEHTLMAAAALIKSDFTVESFLNEFARRLKKWIFTMPAGAGLATLRSCLKLIAGFSPHISGVFSAGNGPSMRIALIGVIFGGDAEELKAFVSAATRITHTDKKAGNAALAVAAAAYASASKKNISPAEYFEMVRGLMPDEQEFLNLMKSAVESAERGETTFEFTQRSGIASGVSGYSYHTVPAAIHCWLSNQNNFREGIISMIRCGGDTDTTAAIAGAIIGAGVGKDGIPVEWIDNIAGWPYTADYMLKLADLLSEAASARAAGNACGTPDGTVDKPLLFAFIKNILTLAAIFFHVAWRLLPPY